MLDHLPVKAHGIANAFFVCGKKNPLARRIFEGFQNRFGGKFTGMHRQEDTGGKDWIHEPCGIAHPEQTLADESFIMIGKVTRSLHFPNDFSFFQSFPERITKPKRQNR